MADIFLSYAHADAAKMAQLASALEKAGYSLWWDRDIGGGRHFAKDIEAALDQSGAVVVAWSKHAAESHWVLDEAGFGRDSSKLVPVSLDGSLPPIGFRQIQAIDFSDGSNRDAAMERLCQAVDQIVGGDAHQPIKIGKANLRTSWAPIAAIALALAAGAGWWAFSGPEIDDASSESILTSAVDRSKSIAVLPFKDLTEGGGQDWLTQGLAEEITFTLAKVPDLVVASTGASAQFGSEASSLDIIRQLRVQHVLEGSVRRLDDTVRINVALVDTSGKQIWAERYERTADDLISVQEELATKVAQSLGTAMDPAALAQMADVGTDSIDAYRDYLMAERMRLSNNGTSEDILALYEQAYTKDPGFSRAHVAAATIYINRTFIGNFGSAEFRGGNADWKDFQQQIRAAKKAASGDKQKLEVDTYMAFAEGRVGDEAALVRRQALLYPNTLLYLGDLILIESLQGDRDRARKILPRFMELGAGEPRLVIQTLGSANFHEEAARLAREEIKGSPDYGLLYVAHRALLRVSAVDEAKRVAGRMQAMLDGGDLPDLVQFRQACAEGDRETAEALLGRATLDDDRWMMLNMLGRKQEAATHIIKYDRETPPFPLRGLIYQPYFDLSDFPHMKARYDGDGIIFRKPTYPISCFEKAE